MPQRNLVILAIAVVVTILCYQFAPRNRYAATVAYAMNLIENQYVDEVAPKVLFTGAMEGMTNQLDPYSGYTGPVESQRFQEHIDQKFGGIGVLVELNQKTKRITVMSPLVGTPAYKAGLLPGDTILAIDDNDTKDLTLRDCVELIHGRKGDPVTLKIAREGSPEPLEFVLIRDIIKVDSVMGDIRQTDGKWRFRLPQHPDIAYLRISQFGDATGREVRDDLQAEYAAGNLKGVILDLRGNAGGLLQAALEVCDSLLDDHEEIVSTRGRDGETLNSYSSQPGTVIPVELPVVVMVDGFSASASEIVAACLQDHGRAKVVGERSWGKGTVQNLIPLPGNNGTLRLTIASFWRPSGVNIHKRREAADEDNDWGVRPDPGCEVKLTVGEMEKLIRARRQRDAFLVEPGQEVPPESATSEEATESSDTPATENELPDDTAATKPPEQLENMGRLPPTEVDPQLRKAVEVLEGMIDSK